MNESQASVAERADTMLAIIREELGSDRIGPADDFYEMGGDSIVAVRVVTRAAAMGIPVRLIDLLTHPTVEELIPNLSEETPPVTAADSVVVAEQGDVAVRPATALQVGLIYQAELAEDSRLYNDLIGVRVLAPLDEVAFGSALSALVRRHGALRSAFDLGGHAEAVQLIWPDVDLPLEVVHRASAAEEKAEVAAWRERRLESSYDWARPPLFACHVAASPEAFTVTFGIHHAIMDGWSFATVLVELLRRYDAAARGVDLALRPLPEQGDAIFAAAERESASSAEAARFWLDQADVPPLLITRDRFAPPADTAGMRPIEFSPELFDGLRAAAGLAKVPLKSLLLAVHCWALARWTGREADVVTGVVVNGRPEVEGADLLVGLFLNTVPIRMAGTRGTWAELAAAVHGAELAGLRHRRHPLAEIEEKLGRPSFDVAFNYTSFHVYADVDDLDIEVDDWWAVDKAGHPMSCDYTVEFPGFGTGLIVTYDENVVTAERVEKFAELVFRGLSAAAADVRGQADA